MSRAWRFVTTTKQHIAKQHLAPLGYKPNFSSSGLVDVLKISIEEMFNSKCHQATVLRTARASRPSLAISTAQFVTYHKIIAR